MQFKIKKVKTSFFKPVRVEIILETPEEVRDLEARAFINPSWLNNNSAGKTAAALIPCSLDKIKRDLEEKTGVKLYP